MTARLGTVLWQSPSVYLTENQLAYALAGTPDSRAARINRAVKKGHLVRVKRGLYYLGERLTAKRPHPFELAQLVYGPSYISFESALSYRGLIPEAVHSVTSATIKRNNAFQTPLGQFVYCKLPLDNFFIAVEYIEENSYQFFMATAWKALLDYIYCYKEMLHELESIAESLRIELEDLPKIDKTELEQLKLFYHSRRIDRFIKSISKDFIYER